MDNISVNALHHRTNRIWNEEQIPDDWRKGLLVNLPKKGDLSLCNNWRGITLLSIPSNFLYSVILQRIKTEVGKTLRDEQEGFRQERSCVDQIATLRIIVEQIIEWQTSLCMNFIGFEKAFDRIDHQVLWKILKHYGIPQKIISIIQQLYDGFSCQVIHDENLTEQFPVTTGVRKDCILSPLLFLMVIGWVSKTVYKEHSLRAYNGHYKPDWKILTS